MPSQPTERTGVTRRERQRQRVIEEIKEAALGELRQQGITGVTMRAVARAIDITPSGLYRYVADHETLIGLLAADAFDDVAELMSTTRIKAAGESLATQWYRCCLALRTWSIEHPDEYGLIFNADPHAPQTENVVDASHRALDALTHLCAAGLADGEIDPRRSEAMEAVTGTDAEFDAQILAASALATLVGHISLEISGRWNYLGGSSEDRFEKVVVAVMFLVGFTRQPERSAGLRVVT
ncbi:TetR family transcriptional regulator [Knoellia remsis]|uniref:TetR family transcriptional regulator n=1 Tax=Knoellia remsis TaxID=407159 RepID=A0A2T0ULJ6_9MICO|nr:TetR/AcrR family transcriptional regulator [Knoellia remsis]PRY58790.1 TetR family transcriptional regulator [Knoellia remsis]